MIPFLLAALGGYLIGQSRRDEQYARGGDIKRPKPIELVLKGKKTGVKGFNFVVYNLNGKDYALVTPMKGEQFVDDYPTKTGKWRKPVFKDGGMAGETEQLPLYYTYEYLKNSPKAKTSWRNWDDDDWMIYGIRYLVYNDIADIEKIGEDKYRVRYKDEDYENDEDGWVTYSANDLMQYAYDKGLPDSSDMEEEEGEYADGGEVKNYKDFEDFSMGVSHKKNEVVLIDGKRYVVSKVTGGSYGDRVDLLGIDAENRNDGIRLLIDTSGGVLKQEKFVSGGYMAKGGFNHNDIKKGDFVNFGSYGNYYVADTDYDALGGNKYFWVVKEEKNRKKSSASGKAMLKSNAKYIVEEYAKGGYMAKGGVVEHGLRKGDKIVSEMYNIAGVINEDTGEAALVDIETGKREEIK